MSRRSWVRVEGTVGDAGRDESVPLQLEARIARHGDRISVEDGSIKFDIPADDYSRLHFAPIGSESEPPIGFVPVDAADSVRVRLDWYARFGPASVEISFFRDGTVARPHRALPLGTGGIDTTVDVPDVDAIGLALRLGGRGLVEIGPAVVTRNNSRSWNAPLGEALTAALRENDFASSAGIGLDSSDQVRASDGSVLVLGERIHIGVEKTWSTLEKRDRSLQLHMHGFSFAEPLLDRSGGAERVAEAKAMGVLFLRWRDLHPMRRHSSTNLAWNDMAVASRSYALLGVIRVLRRLDDHRMVEQLARMAGEHADWLADDANYDPTSNHGLFSDLALHALGRALDGHVWSRSWRRRSSRRFAETLPVVVDVEEMTVREHSTAYVMALLGLVDRALAERMPADRLAEVSRGLADTAAWLTAPDGLLVAWGDTSPADMGLADGRTGLRHFGQTGWSVARHGSGALFMTGSYHSSAHKHADELSIVLYEGDAPILIDPGYPGYGYGTADRDHAVSSAAHNTVLPNGEPFEWRGQAPYGSCLYQPAQTGSWFAFGGSNPLAHPSAHERIVLYQPGGTVVVLDEVRAERPSVAHFHLHPSLSVEREDGRHRLERDGRVVGWIEATDGGGHSVPVEILAPDEAVQITAHFPAFGKRAHHPVLRMTMVDLLQTVFTSGGGTIDVETLWASHTANACTIVLRVVDEVITIRRVAGILYLDVS